MSRCGGMPQNCWRWPGTRYSRTSSCASGSLPVGHTIHPAVSRSTTDVLTPLKKTGPVLKENICAFKLYPGKFLRELRLETRGAMINTEILYKFRHAGLTFTQLDVRHLPRKGGQATGAKPAVILRAFRELFFYAWKWYREKG